MLTFRKDYWSEADGPSPRSETSSSSHYCKNRQARDNTTICFWRYGI